MLGTIYLLFQSSVPQSEIALASAVLPTTALPASDRDAWFSTFKILIKIFIRHEAQSVALVCIHKYNDMLVL